MCGLITRTCLSEVERKEDGGSWGKGQNPRCWFLIFPRNTQILLPSDSGTQAASTECQNPLKKSWRCH